MMGAMTAPQILIQIQKSSGSADYVTLSLVQPNYPEALLRDQLAELGRLLGSEPRGLLVGVVPGGKQNELRFLRSQFAIDGLIDPVTRRFELNAIIKAFLGAEDPYTISSLQIMLQNEAPIPNRTLDKYSDDKVTVVGTFDNNPKSIEYRVMTKTQNPAEINIPLDQPSNKPKPVSPVGPARPTPIIIGIILIAGVALGALVYFAMLRSPKA
jgi:hypothetical protein